ncbi:MAG: hypothetical protein MRK02_07560 [Candidatus Scalindua sp.]|nr:hypothetical protein [Candidatus Scalindua sp.]
MLSEKVKRYAVAAKKRPPAVYCILECLTISNMKEGDKSGEKSITYNMGVQVSYSRLSMSDHKHSKVPNSGPLICCHHEEQKCLGEMSYEQFRKIRQRNHFI